MENICIRYMMCTSSKWTLHRGLFSNERLSVGTSRCSHHPQVLLVYHSDGGRVPPPSETLLFCFVGARKSPPRWSPCRCQPTAGLYAWVRRWWLLHDTEKTGHVLIWSGWVFYRDNVTTDWRIVNAMMGWTNVLTGLTAFIVLKVVAGVAVGIGCSQSPQPGEVGYHAVGSAIHQSWTLHKDGWRTEQDIQTSFLHPFSSTGSIQKTFQRHTLFYIID